MKSKTPCNIALVYNGPADRSKEAMKRHWGAVPFGLHSVPVEFDEVAWDPSRGRSRWSMSRTLRARSCVAATWCSSIPPAASSQENRVSGPSWKTLPPLCSRTLANGFSARVQEDDDADQDSSNDHSTDRRSVPSLSAC